jgi:lipopolysaccharide transport system ATP-binding protein
VPAAIVAQGLGKRFRRYSPDRPRTFQDAILHSLRGLKVEEEFWALRDINLSVERGKMAGVIGPNGAGKSTLLRLIGGVGRPDAGRVAVNGRIGALIDLGAGFHPDLTGRENVFINGIISGLTRREVASQFDAIVDFAELADFIDSPIRTYSTGMQMRLAFAVAAHIEPEILLIDEVLAVGDFSFQRKCLERIAQFKEQGCAIMLVSHDTTLVGQLCDEAIWLRSGRLAAHGPAEVVANQYVAEMKAETQRHTPKTRPVLRAPSGVELRLNENRFGSLELEITAVRLCDDKGEHATELESGGALQVMIEYLAPEPIPAPIFGATISKEDGFICYDTSTAAAGIALPTIQGSGCVSLHLERIDLMGGNYYIDVGAYRADWTYAYDYHWHAYPLKIRPTPGERGVLRPPHYWEVDGVPAMKAGLPELRIK